MSRVSLVFHLIVLLKIMSLTPVRSLDRYSNSEEVYKILFYPSKGLLLNGAALSIIRNEFSFSSKEYFTFFFLPGEEPSQLSTLTVFCNTLYYNRLLTQ